MRGTIDTVVGRACLVGEEPFVYDGIRGWVYELVERPRVLWVRYEVLSECRPSCYDRGVVVPETVGVQYGE